MERTESYGRGCTWRAEYSLPCLQAAICGSLFEEGKCSVYFYKADHQAASWYTLVIFTASMPEYADPVIDWLDAGRGLFGKKLYRESCSLQPNGSYIKDLTLADDDLSRVCFMDNSPISYSWHKGGYVLECRLTSQTTQSPSRGGRRIRTIKRCLIYCRC